MINLDGVKIDLDVRVPMRDGVTLSADVYRPTASGRYPVILFRTPYNKVSDMVVNAGCAFARAGFATIYMDVRGRGDSDGVFVPYRNDGIDGFDAIEWCAVQSWSNGNVGTCGGSYLGRIQWLTALHRPPHLKAMCALVSPSDPFVETPTGTPGPMHLCWLHLVSGRLTQNFYTVDWNKVYEHVPLMTMDEATGRSIPFWREQVSHPQFDAYWDAMSYQNKFEQIDVPVLHISGWYDDEQIGTPLNYEGMTTRGGSGFARKHQQLLMGPWDHAVNSKSKLGEVDFGAKALIDLRGAQIRWFKRWLTDESLEPEPPVRIFVMGKNEWRDEQEWPLARTQHTPYYLHSGGLANSRYGGGALLTQPAAEQMPDHFSYDPERPVPFITEPVSSQIGGPDDYAAIENRSDVLVYTSLVLTDDVEVTGRIMVTLFASSSAPDTDFTAKLLDVWPSGFAQRLCDGMVRARFRDGMDSPSLIEPGKIYEYQIDCWYTSQVFKAGHCIRLEISSSAFPKYDRNHNTGHPLGTDTEFRVAEQTIYHDAEHPSCVMLPIIPAL
ncbi:MAG: CocE/NonD family hydrolase [Anaerolineae bacterium]|nr:CocE/NonD family hydrolase [Anaerolineae bacterium]